MLPALTADLGNVSGDWQRRFLQRAFDALGRIPDDARIRIANEVDKKLKTRRIPPSVRPSFHCRYRGNTHGTECA
jgi:hypothetical protein